jgi:hypothetical protein
MQRRLYAIIVHNIHKTDINIITDIKTIIRIIQTENRPLHGFLDLYRIAWPRQTKKIKKTHGSLIIKVATSAQTNRMIKKNIYIGAEIKIYKLFARKYRFS